MVDFNQQCHLLFDHPELLVHRLEVVSEEAGPVKQLLEVPQGDLPDGARQAAMSEIEGNPKMGSGWCSPRHEGGPAPAVRGAAPQCPESLQQGRLNGEGSGHPW